MDLIMEAKKRVTKLTLAEIPKVGSPFRTSLLKKLTESDIYKEAILKNAALGFSTEELNAIEEKYKNQKGLFNEDIQNEINKKGWLVKSSTIKQYIQKEQLPMSKERRKVKGKGAVSLYPLDFMRHLNFLRYLLNSGRETCEKILNAFTPHPVSQRMSDFSFLQSMFYGELLYDGDYIDEPFLYYGAGDRFLNMGLIKEITEDGLYYYIELFKLAIAVLSGDKNFKIDNKCKHNLMVGDKMNSSLKLFNEMKTKSEFSKNVDSEFFNKAKLRLSKYLLQLQEIKQILENVSERIDSLIEETRKESWT